MMCKISAIRAITANPLQVVCRKEENQDATWPSAAVYDIYSNNESEGSVNWVRMPIRWKRSSTPEWVDPYENIPMLRQGSVENTMWKTEGQDSMRTIACKYSV
ncbi:hypothetical protein TWF730_002003 [Orbilia blumenaviensis]|uniref:Uncharacterized protein n=1 Tax=Orbilia blumenaviensis TaxID=1796055 RepID=A0AAV9UCQ2_9PEZI